MEALITEVDGNINLEITPKTNLEAIALNKFFSSYHRGQKLEYIKENNIHKLRYRRYVSKNYLLASGWEFVVSQYHWYNITLTLTDGNWSLLCDDIFIGNVKSVDDLNLALLQLKTEGRIVYQ